MVCGEVCPTANKLERLQKTEIRATSTIERSVIVRFPEKYDQIPFVRGMVRSLEKYGHISDFDPFVRGMVRSL